MRWLVVGLVLVVAGVVAAFALAVGSTRDGVPARLADCVTKADGVQARDAVTLQAARADIDAGAVREVRRYAFGDDAGVLLRGPRFRLLVVAGRKSPSLAGDVARRAYERAAEYAFVGLEIDPVRDALRGCADLVGTRSPGGA